MIVRTVSDMLLYAHRDLHIRCVFNYLSRKYSSESTLNAIKHIYSTNLRTFFHFQLFPLSHLFIIFDPFYTKTNAKIKVTNM